MVPTYLILDSTVCLPKAVGSKVAVLKWPSVALDQRCMHRRNQSSNSARQRKVLQAGAAKEGDAWEMQMDTTVARKFACTNQWSTPILANGADQWHAIAQKHSSSCVHSHRFKDVCPYVVGVLCCNDAPRVNLYYRQPASCHP